MTVIRTPNGISINEGGRRGVVFVCYWRGPLAFFVDVAIRMPFRWVGFGWCAGRPYLRGHKTGTWNFA